MGEEKKNEVAQFDPQALRDRIAEQVKTSFGMLIPDEQFRSMVEKEVSAYFDTEEPLIWQEEERGNDYYNRKDVHTLKYSMTPFRLQIWKELNKILCDKVADLLNGEKFKMYANIPEEEVGAYLSKKIDEIAPRMAASMFSDLFSQAVNVAKNDIRSELSRM